MNPHRIVRGTHFKTRGEIKLAKRQAEVRKLTTDFDPVYDRPIRDLSGWDEGVKNAAENEEAGFSRGGEIDTDMGIGLPADEDLEGWMELHRKYRAEQEGFEDQDEEVEEVEEDYDWEQERRHANVLEARGFAPRGFARRATARERKDRQRDPSAETGAKNGKSVRFTGISRPDVAAREKRKRELETEEGVGRKTQKARR